MAEINIEKVVQNVAQKAMQELRDNGVFVGRWIPVSERLPEEGKEVLVSGYNTWSKQVIIARYMGEQYGFTCGLVSAWMSLPLPYHEVEE